MLDEVVTWLNRHHELRAEQATDLHLGLHPGDEVSKWTVMVGAVVPRAARPDGVAARTQVLGFQEVVLDDPYPVVQRLEFQPIDQSHGVSAHVTRKLDLASVKGYRVALDSDDAIAHGSEGKNELSITRTNDRDGGVRGDAFPQCGEELGEERQGVLPHALGLHGWLLARR